MDESIERLLSTEARLPLSTYRVQMHAGFTFADAQAIVPYLKKLGIGDLYTSPIFEARPGSLHGYDVARHDRLNPELGGGEGFNQLVGTLRDASMGLLLDIVPNHMGVGNDSMWWQDVLENGRASEYSEYFDIDWKPLKADMEGKLLLPILGKQYGEELESGNIKVVVDDGRVRVRYYDHTMPVAPRTVPMLFSADEQRDLPQSFRDLLRDLEHIPPHTTEDPNLTQQRRQQLAEMRPRLRAALLEPAMQPFLQRALEQINGREGDAASFDRLHALLEAQPYRLAFWRVSSEEINYRRFFDINDLVGLRVENPVVFADTHCLIRELLAQHKVTGLRIDHCDGLLNPRQYLIRLQLLYMASQLYGAKPTTPTGANGIERSLLDALRGREWSTSSRPLYSVVEKILEPRESLPREWPTSGTTGYEFIHLVNQLFIQPQNEKRFNEIYAKFIGHRLDPDEVIYRSKLQVMQTALSSEVYVLTNLLSQIAAEDRRARDFTDNIFETVIRETIACFPVYRTYIDDRGRYTDTDRNFVRQAIARAKRRNPDVDASAFDFLSNTLLLGNVADEKIYQRQLYFALKFQQLTSPVMAKGVEDTSFYVYNRFLSSNEVGSSIKAFGISPETFHEGSRERLEHAAGGLLASSTHDTKRAEGVRARLNVLSEMPVEWSALVRRWQRMNAAFKVKLDDGRLAPDANEEYLIYQTIVGAWPWHIHGPEDRKDFIDRLRQYTAKALSEAKVNLSWVNPDPPYMKAVHDFIERLLTPDKRGRETRFWETLAAAMPALKLFGGINSLAQVVLKVASPGVPDFYQGTELWELSLVDPDNRRPIDYALRSRLLGEMLAMDERQGRAALCRDLLANFDDGRVKLWITHRALALRQQYPALFLRGEYTALSVEHDKQQHAVAFLRRDAEAKKALLAVVPRFAYTLMNGRPAQPLGGAWGDASIQLPEGAPVEYVNVFTGEKVSADERRNLHLKSIFASFPMAMLLSEDE
jgi:(1->4)-alpha-D-glucan 1-alpha-D-glucosylmutase